MPFSDHRLYAARFDEERQRWESPVVSLPTNPNTGGPLLLVPERFLRDLPTLNADDWWIFYENEQLRTDLNYEILHHVDKATIVATARDHPELVRRWTLERESRPAAPYDLLSDPMGTWQWDKATQQFATTNPLQLSPAQSARDFAEVIGTSCASVPPFLYKVAGNCCGIRGANNKPSMQLSYYFVELHNTIARRITSRSTLK